MTCDRCGVTLTIGMYPFCPHGEPLRGRGADVTWPGGKTFENLGPEPVTLYSPAELGREMTRRGLEPFVRHVDGDHYVERWVSVDLTPYHDPAVRRQRQEAMAAHCGLTLDEYLSRLGQTASGVVTREPEIEQAPVIERYIRSIEAPHITGIRPRC